MTSLSRRAWLKTSAAVTAVTVTRTGAGACRDDPGCGMEIWDNHIHLGPFEGTAPVEKADRLLEFADRMGIARLVVFMGWPLVHAPAPEEVRRQNDQVLAALKYAPDRLLGYVYINPADVPESLDEIRRCVVDGPMVGLKLWVAQHCDLNNLDPIIELATRLNAPIYQHTWIKTAGNLEGESTPSQLVTAARRHPEARWICGHAGGNWELGIRIVRDVCSIVVEIAGADPTAGVTEMAVRELTADRVIFGSDAGGRSFASQMAKVYGANISREEKSRILGGNLQQMLEPIMRAKAMI